MNVTATIEGRLTADPELRFTPAGKAVCSFTIACSDRVKNQQTNEWEDKAATFWRCSAWEQLAENIAESLTRGTHVIATGKISQREFTTREGEKRTVFEVRIYQIGPCLQFATAKVNKVTRGSTTTAAPAASAPAAEDPFADEPPY